MSKLIAARGAQTVMSAEFVFNFDDTMVNVAGAEVDFGKTNIAASVFEISNLPGNAIIVGGEVVTDTAFDAATYTVSVGDSSSATRYLGATDRKGVGRSALVPTGYRPDGKRVRLSVTAADVCTTGKMSVRIQYITEGRVTEVNPS